MMTAAFLQVSHVAFSKIHLITTHREEIPSIRFNYYLITFIYNVNLLGFIQSLYIIPSSMLPLQLKVFLLSSRTVLVFGYCKNPKRYSSLVVF